MKKQIKGILFVLMSGMFFISNAYALDLTAPYLSGRQPASGATGVLVGSNVVVHVKDDGVGVDDTTIVLTVDGVTAFDGSDPDPATNYPNTTLSGSEADYILTYNPPSDFAYNDTIDVSVSADDLDVNSFSDSYSFTTQAVPDLTPPNIYDADKPGNQPFTDDSTPRKSKQWNWKADEAATFRHSVDQNPAGAPSGSFSSTQTFTQPGGDGTYYLHLQARDISLNVSAVVTVSAVLDNTPPSATLSGTPSNPTTATALDIIVGGAGVDTYQYHIDGGADSAYRSVGTHITDTVSYGEHTVYVKGKDTAGNPQTNYTPYSWDSRSELVAPYISGQQPASGATGVLVGSNVVVHVKDDGQGVDDTTIVLTVEGVTAFDGSDPDPATNYPNTSISGSESDYTLTYNPPSDFAYNDTINVSVSAKDLTRNSLSTNYSFDTQAVPDVTPPTIYDADKSPLGPLDDDPAPRQSKTWRWTANESGISYRVIIDNNASTVVPTGSSYTGVQTATISAPGYADGVWYLHVRAKDASDNYSDTVTVSAVLDNTGPTVTGLTDDVVARKTKTWTWDSLDGGVDFRRVIDQVAVVGPGHTIYSAAYTAGLKSDSQSVGTGTFYIHVQARDALHNEGNVVTVSAILDNAPPVLSGLSNDNTPTSSKTWTWSSDDPNAEYRYGIDQNSGGLPTSGYSVSNTSATQSSGNGTYYIHVQARDALHNESEVTTVSAILSNPAPDTTPPNIYDADKPGNQPLTDDSTPKKIKQWNWKADESATFRYSVDQNAGGAPSGSFSSTQTFTQSSGTGTYYLHLQAQDDSPNHNVSGVVTVSAVLDNTGPTVTGLTDDAVAKKTKTWTWDSLDGGVDFRRVIDQVAVVGPGHAIYSAAYTAGLKSDSQSVGTGTYYIHVQARDALHNEGEVVTVSVVLDNTPPRIIGLSSDSTAVKARAWTWGSDDPKAEYRYGVDQDPNGLPKSDYSASNTSTAQVTGNGTYYLHVQARDALKNESVVTTVSAILSNPVIAVLSGAPTKAVTYNNAGISVSAVGGEAYKYRLDDPDLESITQEHPFSQKIVLSNLSEGKHTLYVSARDASGKFGPAASAEWSVDTIRPQTQIASILPDPTRVSPIPVTVSFGEEITGFTKAALVVTNAGVDNFKAGESAGTYTFDLYPADQGEVKVNIAEGAALDNALHKSIPAEFSRVYDSKKPTVTLTSSDPETLKSSPFKVKIEFSEKVVSFTMDKITFTNGVLTSFRSEEDGKIYTIEAAFLREGPATVGIAADAVQDPAGNLSERSNTISRTLAQAPFVLLTFSRDLKDPTNVSPLPVSVNFNEEVYGFESGDIKVTNGKVTRFAPVSGSKKEYAVEVTPEGIDKIKVSIDIPAKVAADAAGNGNDPATQLSITYDGLRPEVKLSRDVSSSTDNLIAVKAVFTEDVSGFISAGIQVTNGVVRDFNAFNAKEYGFKVVAEKDGEVTARVSENSAFDLAGNGNTASAVLSVTYTSDVNPPVIDSFSPSDGDLSSGRVIVTEGAPAPFSVVAHDKEKGKDGLSYSWSVDGKGVKAAVPDQLSYTFGFRAADSGAEHSVKVIVSDGKYTVNKEWKFTVRDSNSAPYPLSISPDVASLEIIQGRSREFKALMDDKEDDIFSYSWKLDGREVSTTDSFTYSPGFKDPAGAHDLLFTVSDGKLEFSRSWTVTVKAAVKEPFSWDFEQDNDAEGWENAGDLMSPVVEGGLLTAPYTGVDPQMVLNSSLLSTPLSIDPAKFQTLRVCYSLNSGTSAQLYWSNSALRAAGKFGVVDFPIYADGRFHVASVDMGNNKLWTDYGDITYLRFDPVAAALPITGDAEIDYIRILEGRPQQALSWKFNTNDDFEGWHALKDILGVSVSAGNFTAVISGPDPIIYTGAATEASSNLSIDADVFKGVRLNMKFDTGKCRYVGLCWFNNGQFHRHNFTVIADGTFHVYDLDLSEVPEWSGNVHYLRLDPEQASGSFYLDYINIVDLISAPAWEFNATGDAGNWAAVKSISNLTVSGGSLSANLIGDDPYMANSAVDFPANAYPYLRVRMKSSSGRSAQIYWMTRLPSGDARSGNCNFDITPDGEYHSYTLDLSGFASWKDGQVVYLRIDPTVAGGTLSEPVKISLDYIRFSSSAFVPEPPDWEFNIPDNNQGWQGGDDLSSLNVAGGILFTAVQGRDPKLFSPLANSATAVDASVYKIIEVRMAVIGSHVSSSQVFWKRLGDTVFSGERELDFPISSDSDFHVYRFKMDSSPNWSGKIIQLRIDPITAFREGIDSPGIEVQIDYIRVLSEAPVWEFDANGDSLGWFNQNGLSAFSVEGGILSSTVTGTDPKMISPDITANPISASSYKTVEIMMAVAGGHINRAQLYWAREGESFSADRGVDFSISMDNDFHVYTVNLANNANWSGGIVRLRLDPVSTVRPEDDSNIQISIDHIRVKE